MLDGILVATLFQRWTAENIVPPDKTKSVPQLLPDALRGGKNKAGAATVDKFGTYFYTIIPIKAAFILFTANFSFKAKSVKNYESEKPSDPGINRITLCC